MKKLIFAFATLCLASSSLFAQVPVCPDPTKGDWPPPVAMVLALFAH
jgi:hypothetical protein